MQLNTKVFNFVKPSFTATLNSSYIAKLISETLDCPLVWDRETCSEPLDLLIVVSGPFAFSAGREYLAKAVKQARRVVWCENDYTVIPPKHTSNGKSPFRACWRQRYKADLPNMDFWTTLRDSTAKATPLSRYVNWNMMNYQPLDATTRTKLRRKARDDLFYYGAYRAGREMYFHRYFDSPKVPLTISGERPQWRQNWPSANIIRAVPRTDFYTELAQHGLGLYIEDKKSHRIFCSPASRFYEMLAAGLPMVFQPEAVEMLRQADIDVTGYIARDSDEVKLLMKYRNKIGNEQQEKWAKTNYLERLKFHIRSAYKAQVRELTK